MTEPLTEQKQKTCFRCPTPILIGQVVRAFHQGKLVEQELCDACMAKREYKLEVLAIHGYCNIIPEMV